jgi:NhaA family Na+:H+ antiporter
VLPIFALANCGVVIAADIFGRPRQLMAAIVCGLAIGKPRAFMLASWLAVKVGSRRETRRVLVAASWAAAGALLASVSRCHCSLPARRSRMGDFAAAKIAVFAASVLSAIIGVSVLVGSTVARTEKASS